MARPSVATARVCRQYAILICRIRRLSTMQVSSLGLRLRLLNEAARKTYEEAPEEALPYLDTVKRILEIDYYQTNPAIILMRASVEAPRREHR